MSKKYIVVGSSAAGIGALSKLRSLDSTAEITCVTASSEMPYNTCLLADYLAGSRNEQSVFTKQQQFFDDNNIKLVRGTKLVAINREEKIALFDDGTSRQYDYLFLGLGMTARKPHLPEAEKAEGIFSFHTLNDTHKLLAYIKKHHVRQAVVVGAGLSGVECADALASNKVSVALVERGLHVLPSQVDMHGSRVIERAMSKQGVIYYPQQSVVSIGQKDGGVAQVGLASGVTLDATMIVFTIGASPNTHVAQQAGLVMQAGRLAVDSRMKTSDDSIYAGGDMCVVPSAISDELVPNTTWPDAMMQGMTAAFSMTGKPRVYPGLLPIASSNFFDTTFVSCGPVLDFERYEHVVTKDEPDAYHKVVLDDAKVIGFLMVGNIENVGQMRKMVLTAAPLVL